MFLTVCWSSSLNVHDCRNSARWRANHWASDQRHEKGKYLLPGNSICRTTISCIVAQVPWHMTISLTFSLKPSRAWQHYVTNKDPSRQLEARQDWCRSKVVISWALLTQQLMMNQKHQQLLQQTEQLQICQIRPQQQHQQRNM